MANVVIYYQKKEYEDTKQAIQDINKLIVKLEIHHVIKGVFVDDYKSRNYLTELFNSSLTIIDHIYIEKPLNDEFDNDLLSQLSHAEQFAIKYFHEI